MKIPEDYIEFLHWVKERTEAFWSKDPDTSTDEFVCKKWAHGAKWIGMDEAEIDEVEKEFNIQFTWHHRQFLKILHTIDRKEVIPYTETFDEDEEEKYQEYPFFYNWKMDKEELKERMKWPYETMLSDVTGANKVWLKSWGKVRPKSDEEKEKTFAGWFKNVPPLIPITGHRFLVSDAIDKDSPVLSVWGTDIVVYGWNMRHYLINELKQELDLLEMVYDEEDDMNYPEFIAELQDINDYEYGVAKEKKIPVLEEMILFWSSGWAAYGEEFPNPNNETVRPIVKTFIPEDEEDTQKRFNDFNQED